MTSMFQHFIKPGKLDWGSFVKRYSAEPRRILKKDEAAIAEGVAAELVLFDPEA